MSSELFLSENENKRKGLLVAVFVIIQNNFTRVLMLILGLNMLCDHAVKVILNFQD